ncbi:hypothetical protein MVEN_01710700 [Mycena venus]|uniref:Uncharacterized protein n=1 Tax=Mycena venus TaxID=2733690 RepID=A0A8H7CQ70_9AGAR|nr:hypothetical protein MVEN_01710700 [Mycena venus]
MNDAPLNGNEVDLYVKFATEPPGPITVLSAVTAAPGVAAALPIPGQSPDTDTTVVIDQDSAYDALGLQPGSLGLGPLLAAVIGSASINEGFLLVPRGDVIRSDQLPLNSTVFAQILEVNVNNNSTVVLFAGTENFTTSGIANGDNRFMLLEGVLQGLLDVRIVDPIASTDPGAASIVEQYEAMIQSEDTSAFTTKITPSVLPCSLTGLNSLD